MQTEVRFASRLWGLVCVAITALAMLLVHPVVENGIVDDWSIVRTAQRLSETGHLHYNGWEAPMLGWPLYLAAGAFRLFGFSFTAARLTLMVITLCAVYVMQRILARSGVSAVNSALGTLSLALCPLFFQCGVLFMSDVPGLFAVLVCFVCCLRAVQASPERAGLWLIAAALSNTLLGTARQIAWLGLIVVVPSALLLLWQNRRARFQGLAAWVGGLGLIALALHWFDRQPYVLPEHLIYHAPHPPITRLVPRVLFKLVLDLTLLVLPVPLAFVAKFRPSRKGFTALGLAAALLLVGLLALLFTHPNTRLAPFLLFPLPQTAENTFLSYPMPVLGTSPSSLWPTLRYLWTLGALAGVLAVAAVSVDARQKAPVVLSDRSLFVLTVPFILAYLLLLLPRALFIFTLDRYLLFLLPFALLLLLRLYERIGDPRFGPLPCTALAVMALYTVFTTHDLFAVHRANLQAVDRIRAAGVPRDQISGGTEYNAYTQMVEGGFIHAGGIRLPGGVIASDARAFPPTACWQPQMELFPSVHPRYALAYPGSSCAPAAGFAPVTFSTWLPPFHRTIQIVHYPNPAMATP